MMFLLGFMLTFSFFVTGFPTTDSNLNNISKRKWYVSRKCCWTLFFIFNSPGKHKKTKTIKAQCSQGKNSFHLSPGNQRRLWPIAIEQNLIIPWCGCDRRSIWAISESNRCRFWKKVECESPMGGWKWCSFRIPKNETFGVFIYIIIELYYTGYSIYVYIYIDVIDYRHMGNLKFNLTFLLIGLFHDLNLVISKLRTA